MMGDVAPTFSGPMLSFLPCDQLAATLRKPVQLRAQTIHLWGCLLDGPASCRETFQDWLDREEQSRAARLVYEEDRCRFIFAHGSLRALLCRYVECDPAALTFGRGANGKPFLSSQDVHNPVTFSLAHSHGRMLLAVAGKQEIGADLEKMRPDVDVLKLAERFYAVPERIRIAAMPEEERNRQFFRYWVAKEAVLKGQGIGLKSLTDCEVSPANHHERSSVRITAGSALQPDWNVQWISCGPEWEGAVAFQGEWSMCEMSAT